MVASLSKTRHCRISDSNLGVLVLGRSNEQWQIQTSAGGLLPFLRGLVIQANNRTVVHCLLPDRSFCSSLDALIRCTCDSVWSARCRDICRRGARILSQYRVCTLDQ